MIRSVLAEMGLIDPELAPARGRLQYKRVLPLEVIFTGTRFLLKIEINLQLRQVRVW